ncbi:DUF7146 domain-containing protein [Consotaella aegiceratis]|uniref:DUF7146 domain-containing protein n=1 Tax=Consotaella aegiceratis TaxID=3097961 RepID=UPI002F3F0119
MLFSCNCVCDGTHFVLHCGMLSVMWKVDPDHHGDLLDLIRFALNLTTFREIADEARRFLGHPEQQRIALVPAKTADTRAPPSERARRLFSLGHTIDRTAAEAYLKNRGIERFGPALRYHEAVFFRDYARQAFGQLPAMLASVTDCSGRLTGVARTWLDRERDSIASIEDPKRALGQIAGNTVRFGAVGADLMAGEGIETMLSVGSALPKMPLAACLTARHLSLFEIPPNLKTLWIARDNDEAGATAARLLKAKVQTQRPEIEVIELTSFLGDFNDDLQSLGIDGLQQELMATQGGA